MMEGSQVVTARVLSVRAAAAGRTGRVSVRGATVEVALDLVPEVRVGDRVLVHAGVALSVVREDRGSGDREA